MENSEIFERALKYTFGNEGEYSDNPNDHGGATSRFGITQSELSRWRGHSVSKQEVKDMPESEAKALYKAWYWRPIGLEGVKNPFICIAMFDIAVVMGIGIPPKYSQRICNAHGANLTVDGKVGPKTQAELNNISTKAFIEDFSQLVELRFRSIVEHNPSQRVFIRGWVARARRLLTLI